MATTRTFPSNSRARRLRLANLPTPVLRMGGGVCEQLLQENVWHQLFAARPATQPSGKHLDYVVKVLRAEHRTNQILISSLSREAAIGRRRHGSHLVPIVNAQLSKPPYFLVYPKLPGTTLSHRLKNGQPISTTTALWIVRQSCDALQTLHQAGWLHGDVKPDNIVVSPSGHVTLLDMGAAEPIDGQSHLIDTPFLGTLRYTAPERIFSRFAHQVQSDLYSIGVVLFECLTGTVPFDGSSPGDVIDAHRRKPPPDLRRLMPSLSQGVSTLVHHLLAKDPARRPHSVNDVVRTLVALEIETLRDHAA